MSSAQRQALLAAADWYAKQLAEPDNLRLQQAKQLWLAEHELHVWAWQRVEQLQQSLKPLPAQLTAQTYEQYQKTQGITRRHALRNFCILAVGAGVAWQSYRYSPVFFADYSTAKGEQKKITLPDGGSLMLNTDSAVNIDYSAEQRELYLVRGEVYIETGKDARPFFLSNKHGRMQALGTRFSVQQNEHTSLLSVEQHAVQLTLAQSHEQVRVEQGTSYRFDGQSHKHRALQPFVSSWVKGFLAVDNWPLSKVLAELERYHYVLISCDEHAAKLRISGAFPVLDLTTTLNAIERAVPVKVQEKLGFWLQVNALS